MNSSFSHESFAQMPLIGIIRNIAFDDVREILPVYRQSGLTTIEITMNTLDVDKIIPYARTHFPDLNIGAGTVCSLDDLMHALDLGAQFIVTPVVVKKVIKACRKQDIPIFPGAYTPSEIFTAWSLGAQMVKVYPASTLGPGYIRDLKAPLGRIKLLPTGGIKLENILSFQEAGADGYGIGSQLFQPSLIAEKNWPALQAHFEAFVQKLQGDNAEI